MKRAVIRLPSEIVDRLDRLAEELRVAHPEESYSRASVVRALLSSGLTLAEVEKERLLEVARRRDGGSASRPPPPKPPARTTSDPRSCGGPEREGAP